MIKKRMFGMITGVVSVDACFHMMDAYATGFKAETLGQRLGAIAIGLLILVLLMGVFKRYFSASFFHGFLVATGLFLSFDIVVFHWIFKLHRITNGPEANWLEPLFVLFGTFLLIYGIKGERRYKIQQNDKTFNTHSF
jgi:uncharacterized membrane protein